MDGTRASLLEAFMPAYEVRARYETRIRATPAATYQALRRTDLFAPWPVRALFALRALPARIACGRAPHDGMRTLADAERAGLVLGVDPGREIVLGLIGRFWSLRGNAPIRVAPSDFPGFAEPGFAKAVVAFTLDPMNDGTTRLRTETRVLCTDVASRRKFRLYWLTIELFSGLIRIMWLAAVRKAAERGSLGARAVS